MICRAISQPERLKMWAAAGNELPVGMRLGWNCDVPYCGDFEHMELARDGNHNKFHWGEIAAKVGALAIDEWADFPDLILPTHRIGVALGMNSLSRNVKFVMRQLPTGRGHRIVRVGTWGCLGRDTEVSDTPVPLMFGKRIRPWRRTTSVWLGQIFGHLTSPQFRRPLCCKIKACPMPVFKGAGDYCYQHNHFFDYNESMTDRALDHSTVARPGMPLAWAAMCALSAEYPRSIASLERSLNFEMSNSGFKRPTDNRHKNLGNDSTTNYSRSSFRFGIGRGKNSSSSKTTKGRRTAIARGKGSHDDAKIKRWTRETFDSLEKQADEILKAEMGAKALEMRESQTRTLRAVPIATEATLAEHYETFEEVLTEEEERDQIIEQLARVNLFDSYETRDEHSD